ncbi:sulfite exporter TauE/SafE family protein [Metabacillus sp. SLBN-84]
METILFLAGGAAIGIMSGFFGIGGGIILTPVLLILGYDPSQAVILSLMLTLGSTITGTITHFRLKHIHVSLAARLGLFGMIGAVSTAPAVRLLEEVHSASAVISLAYIGILGWFSYQFLRRVKEVKKPKKGSVPMIGLLTGAVSSLMGVSGGFVMTPLLKNFRDIELNKAIGTSIAAASIIVLSGIGSYLFSGAELDYTHGALLIAGAMIGTPAGSMQLRKFPEAYVKKMLGLLYLVVAGSVIFTFMSVPAVSLALIGTACMIFFVLLVFKSARRVLAAE